MANGDPGAGANAGRANALAAPTNSSRTTTPATTANRGVAEAQLLTPKRLEMHLSRICRRLMRGSNRMTPVLQSLDVDETSDSPLRRRPAHGRCTFICASQVRKSMAACASAGARAGLPCEPGDPHQ